MTKLTKNSVEKSIPPLCIKSDVEIFHNMSGPKYEIDWKAGSSGVLRFYDVAAYGWCIATLPISAGRGGFADRTYGIRVDDGTIVRIGSGPHVRSTVDVYLRKNRLEALKPYIDLYNTGMVQAGTIRDRISTRRAVGQLRRTTFSMPAWR